MLWGNALDMLKGVYLAASKAGVFPSYAAIPFVIAAGPRTGSTLLQTLLNSHPNAVCMHELLRPKAGPPVFYRHYLGSRRRLLRLREEDTGSFLEEVLLTPQPPWVHAIGFKALWVQPEKLTREGTWSSLGRISDLRTIWLTRNELRSVLSFAVAKESGAWIGKKTKTAVHVDVEYILRRLDLEKNCREMAWDKVKDTQILTVEYENLACDTGFELKRIMRFLELPDKEVSSSLSKQNAKPLHELVDNYEELKSALQGTAWQPVLDRAENLV